MKIDKYLGVYGEDYEELMTKKIYDNMKCVWTLDNISCLTIIEFINYNLKQLLKNNISLIHLYQLTKTSCSLLSNNTTENNYIDTDLVKLNNIIIDCISSIVLEKPSNSYRDIYKLMCETENTNKDVLDKLVQQNKTLEDKDIVIDDFKRKLVCKICCTNELNICLKRLWTPLLFRLY